MQRDLSELGWQGAEAGMKRAAEHAESDAPGWGERAYGALVAYLAAHKGQTFIAPAVRTWSEETYRLDPPATNWAWGGVIRRASNRGLIKRVGHSSYGDTVAHTRTVVIWTGTEGT